MQGETAVEPIAKPNRIHRALLPSLELLGMSDPAAIKPMSSEPRFVRMG